MLHLKVVSYVQNYRSELAQLKLKWGHCILKFYDKFCDIIYNDIYFM